MVCKFLFDNPSPDALQVAIMIMDFAIEEYPREGTLHLSCAQMVCYHAVRIMQAHPIPEEDPVDTAMQLLQVASEYIIQAKRNSKGYSGFPTRVRVQIEQRRLESKLKILERHGQVALMHGLLFLSTDAETMSDDVDIKALEDEANRYHLQTLQEIKSVPLYGISNSQSRLVGVSGLTFEVEKLTLMCYLFSLIKYHRTVRLNAKSNVNVHSTCH